MKIKHIVIRDFEEGEIIDVNESLFEFIKEVKYMMDLYGTGRYTRAEQMRDKLAEQLDDIMRLGNL